MAGFSDSMQQTDGVEVKVECGHPHVKPGETCPLCGKTLPKEDSDNGTN